MISKPQWVLCSSGDPIPKGAIIGGNNSNGYSFPFCFENIISFNRRRLVYCQGKA